MKFERGLVVRSKAGHDEYSYFVVLESDERFAAVADGKTRTLEKPKKKNRIHLAPTNTIIPNGSMQTDKAIRIALREFEARFGSDN